MKQALFTTLFLITNFVCQNNGMFSDFNIKSRCSYSFDSLAKMNVFYYVDKMPEYPGGEARMLTFIAKNFKYPNQEYFQASFHLEFVVTSSGAVIAVRIKDKKVGLTAAEKELLKVIRKMPRCKPGSCFGKTVPVKIDFPLYL